MKHINSFRDIMPMNNAEFLFVNNPIRTLIQENIEIKFIKKCSSIRHNEILLEMGCGRGIGTKLIKKHFSPALINAIDIDKKSIQVAKAKNKDSSIIFCVGNATKLGFEKNKFDAVIEFTMMHHLKNWRLCIKEVKRVLKPGGEFIVDDFSVKSFQTLFGKFLNKIFKHNLDEMYKENEFHKELERTGFKIINKRSFYPGHFILIARKL